MQDKGADATKLGLGSSAAALVAALAAHDLARGIAIDHPSIFRRAKEIHQRAQGGGSGVDVASSTFGGTLRYQEGTPTAAKLPEGLVLEVWWSGLAARTSTFLSAVRAFAASAPANYKCIMHALVEASERAADPSTGLAAFLEAARAFSQGLADLGTSAAVPIVPGSFAALSAQAVLEGGAFFGSGAGGGDVAIFLGSSPSSPRFAALAAEHHVLRVPLGIADGGVASY
jgi:phosphomevalonate kinase